MRKNQTFWSPKIKIQIPDRQIVGDGDGSRIAQENCGSRREIVERQEHEQKRQEEAAKGKLFENSVNKILRYDFWKST